MSRIKIATSLGAATAGLTMLATLAAIEPTGDVELRDLKLEGWNCSMKDDGTAQSQEAKERNRMKNRWSVNLSGFAVEYVDTASFLKKVREYDLLIQGRHRGGLTAAQREELDADENQIVSLTGWLVLAYAGPPETTNCGDETFHDWHLEIFEKPSDHAPQVGDPTPIICEITPRTERIIYRDGVRIQSLTGFFRLSDASYRATGHAAQKVRVTGYLMWDDQHNSSAEVGSTIQRIGRNGLHQPWRSTAWEIHPVMKVEVIRN
jgi:hypothetical protein